MTIIIDGKEISKKLREDLNKEINLKDHTLIFDFKENKIIAIRVNEEKNNLALKIIPELISSDARLGISGSFIELNQLFEKKNAI